MRRILFPLTLLAAGCAQSRMPDPQPAHLPRREPVVRVYLRSLEDWKQIKVVGKGGMVVDEGSGPVDSPEEMSYVLDRDGAPSRLFLRPRGNVFTVNGRSYSGELAIRNGRLINHVPLENYVLGVLRGELPLGDVPQGAAEAQAIAARSYTMYYLRHGAGEDFDLDDTILFQVYAGLRYAPSDDALRAGVQATRGIYLEHRGLPVKSYFHSTCGGHTTDVVTGLNRAASPVMSGVPCEWCKASKYYRWEATLEDAAILKAARLGGREPVLEVVKRGAGDRVARMTITSSEGSRTMLACEFRLAAGPSKLRSTLLRSLRRADGGVHVEGAGWGHGVGLCQMGAIGQAREGRTGREIASYYYRGAEIRQGY